MPRISIGGGFKPKISHYKEKIITRVDGSHCAECNSILLSARGKVHAIPDNSDKSEFGTKRICHACFVELEKEAKKKKDLADGKEPED